MYDVVIVGGGPAGLTAAIYARRAAKTVLVIEAQNCGGQIVNTPSVENYPAEPHISGFDFAMRICEQAKDLGAKIVYDTVTGIKREDGYMTVLCKKRSAEARTVILAAGSKNRKLGLPNEDKLIGRGISYCATCDGNFYKNKTVAVVGGGSTALEDALYLSDLAAKVYLIHRRASFRGEEHTAAKLRERANVEIVWNSTVTALIADARLTAVETTDKEGKSRTIATDALFIAVGREPQNDAFSDLVELDGAGYIAAGEDCKTCTPGLFAAGDCRVKTVRQLVTAASDGAVAATAAIAYLNG